jgi:hypothetical protein
VMLLVMFGVELKGTNGMNLMWGVVNYWCDRKLYLTNYEDLIRRTILNWK